MCWCEADLWNRTAPFDFSDAENTQIRNCSCFFGTDPLITHIEKYKISVHLAGTVVTDLLKKRQILLAIATGIEVFTTVNRTQTLIGDPLSKTEDVYDKKIINN